MSVGERSSIIRSYIFSESIPVGLVKDRSPLGHSGQRRLHEVVGSTEILTGNPFIDGVLATLEY